MEDISNRKMMAEVKLEKKFKEEEAAVEIWIYLRRLKWVIWREMDGYKKNSSRIRAIRWTHYSGLPMKHVFRNGILSTFNQNFNTKPEKQQHAYKKKLVKGAKLEENNRVIILRSHPRKSKNETRSINEQTSLNIDLYDSFLEKSQTSVTMKYANFCY